MRASSVSLPTPLEWKTVLRLIQFRKQYKQQKARAHSTAAAAKFTAYENAPFKAVQLPTSCEYPPQWEPAAGPQSFTSSTPVLIANCRSWKKEEEEEGCTRWLSSWLALAKRHGFSQGQLCRTAEPGPWGWAAAQSWTLPNGLGKTTVAPVTLTSRDLRALVFNSSNKNRGSSQLPVKPNPCLLPYTLRSLFHHRFVCHSWPLGTEQPTSHPTGLVQPSAQLQDMSGALTALEAWKSILMGRIFEREDFCVADSQRGLSTRSSLFTHVLFHKIFNNMPKSFPTQQSMLESFWPMLVLRQSR